METFRVPVSQFRSLPFPSGSASKLGLFSVKIDHVPLGLWTWREVNPREVNTGTKVYDAIFATLTDEPDRFFERNRGLTIAAKEVEFDDKKKEVVIKLGDRSIHGLIDGGHTLAAIREVQGNPPKGSGAAYVFFKVFTGVDAEQIAEIAGGLNTSQQVDLKSLENLKGHFEQLQTRLAGKSYAEKIAYKMNQDRPVDVRDILSYLAVFNCDEYNENKHPTHLFGRKEGLIRKFAEEAAGEEKATFRILISRAPDILELRDLIEKQTLTLEDVGRFKAGKNERIRSKKNRQNELHFLNEKVDGKVPLGWIMPMLGAFRANVHWQQPKGSFSWKIDNAGLLKECLPKLFDCIREIHERENRRPEQVGRSATAWRLCYETVQNTILHYELRRATRAR